MQTVYLIAIVALNYHSKKNVNRVYETICTTFETISLVQDYAKKTVS